MDYEERAQIAETNLSIVNKRISELEAENAKLRQQVEMHDGYANRIEELECKVYSSKQLNIAHVETINMLRSSREEDMREAWNAAKSAMLDVMVFDDTTRPEQTFDQWKMKEKQP